jgi:alpha-L-arabinofuranosidase
VTAVISVRPFDKARILTAPMLNSRNTFDEPEVVKPAAFNGARIDRDTLIVDLPPISIVVIELQ